ncbi:Glucosamine/galactosamine-6-phosphate isomerase, partial [Dillenia turbinata]
SSLSLSSTAEMAVGESKTKVNEFDSEEDLSVSLAKYTADLSEKFAKRRGAFTVVLSGGYLIDCLTKLVESPYLETVDWGKWHVFWVDERVVPKDHVDSNYKLAYDGFLSKVFDLDFSSFFKLLFVLPMLFLTTVIDLHILFILLCNPLQPLFLLLWRVPIPSGQVYAINDALSAEGAADDYETCLKHLLDNGVIRLSTATGFPKFDL